MLGKYRIASPEGCCSSTMAIGAEDGGGSNQVKSEIASLPLRASRNDMWFGDMNAFGLFAGIVTLLIIGMGFPLVIHGERHLGYLWWPYMMGTGFVLVGISLFVQAAWASLLIAALGATFVWGSTELKEQAVRAKLGWYPSNSHKPAPPFEAVIKRWKAPHL